MGVSRKGKSLFVHGRNIANGHHQYMQTLDVELCEYAFEAFMQ
jgi:hypothetical protein